MSDILEVIGVSGGFPMVPAATRGQRDGLLVEFRPDQRPIITRDSRISIIIDGFEPGWDGKKDHVVDVTLMRSNGSAVWQGRCMRSHLKELPAIVTNPPSVIGDIASWGGSGVYPGEPKP